MFQSKIKKLSHFLAGLSLGILVLGFTGIVAANSTFSGPRNQPPNGTIKPIFDGLTINGHLRVNPGVGDSVYMEDVYVDGLEVDRLSGCFGCPSADTFANGSQYLRIVSPVIDVSSTDIDMGSIASGAKVDIWSHIEARSIGYMYEVNSDKTLNNSNVGRFHLAAASCASTNYLISCNGYLQDSGVDYVFQGTTSSNNRYCYAYARQKESSASNATLRVEATCWDPDNAYNTNF